MIEFITQKLRALRHGPLRGLSPVWVFLGRIYRAIGKSTGLLRPVATRIGVYGPFKLNGMFTFSDFEHWGDGHNNGFADCIEACRGKSCVLDVGGHIGLVSLPVSEVLAEGGRVFTFEPAEANRRMLLEHVALNNATNIEVVSDLVGAEEKDDVEFFESAEPTGMNSVVIPKHHDSYSPARKRQITLDGFYSDHDLATDVVKIDVEGAELAVLRGAKEALHRHHPVIFLSVHPREIALLGESFKGLEDLIDEIGYECRNIDGSPVSGFALREYILTPKQD